MKKKLETRMAGLKGAKIRVCCPKKDPNELPQLVDVNQVIDGAGSYKVTIACAYDRCSEDALSIVTDGEWVTITAFGDHTLAVEK